MKFWRRWHKWLGVLVGIQVLLWISGGVIMSVIPIDTVRGQHLLKPLVPSATAWSQNHLSVYRPDLNLWQKVERKTRAGHAYWQLTDLDDQVFRVDAATGAPLPPLDSQQTRQLALAQYQGEGQVVNVELINLLPAEVDHLQAPVYRVRFDDWFNTSFYQDVFSGEVQSVRSDIWYLYDFFWMLHIMDYQTRENFNNPLLIVAAMLALLFTCSGFVLLYCSLLRPQFRKFNYALRQRMQS